MLVVNLLVFSTNVTYSSVDFVDTGNNTLHIINMTAYLELDSVDIPVTFQYAYFSSVLICRFTLYTNSSKVHVSGNSTYFLFGDSWLTSIFASEWPFSGTTVQPLLANHQILLMILSSICW